MIRPARGLSIPGPGERAREGVRPRTRSPAPMAKRASVADEARLTTRGPGGGSAGAQASHGRPCLAVPGLT